MKLTRAEIRRAVRAALAEDLGGGDATTLATVPANAMAKAVMRAREPLVVAGLDFAETAFRELSRKIQIGEKLRDGKPARDGEILLEISGPARALLSAERVALNFVQRLSGVATLTAQFAKAVKGTGAQVLDTRKTTPGWRRFEKYAVACGGGKNHRFGLDDMILIKDNHLTALKNEQPNAIAAAIQRARKQFPKLKVEVEADTLEQVTQAANCRRGHHPARQHEFEAVARGGENHRGPRQDRGQRRREFENRPRDCRDRRGFHFRRRAHAFGARGGHRFGF